MINRRTFLKCSAISAGALALSGMSGCSSAKGGSNNASAPVNDAAAEAGAAGPVASFFIMSDTHISLAGDGLRAFANERFENALSDIASTGVAYDKILVLGDIADNGEQEEYDKFKDIVAHSAFDLDKDFLVACGNHDQRSEAELEDWDYYEQKHDQFIANFGLPGLYYEKTIAGQHFLVMGPDGMGETWARFAFSQDQLDWLDARLASDAQSGVRSIVLCHEPIAGTVTGALDGQWGYSNSLADPEPLRALVEKYPTCLFISGHTHVAPDATRADAAHPLYITDGSCGYTYRLDKPWAEQGNMLSYGLRMDVYEDRVALRARDFLSHAWDGDERTVAI